MVYDKIKTTKVVCGFNYIIYPNGFLCYSYCISFKYQTCLFFA